MNIQEKYIALINELYRSFDFFNNHYCQGNLKRPIITVQGEKRKGRTYGWFGKEFWTEHNEDGSNKINELNLTAEALYREPKHVLETLLHEMAHLKNAQEDIFDCNSITQHHNKAFKKAAEFFGLEVSKMKGRGWAKTDLTEASEGVIALLAPKLELYKIVRTPPTRLKTENKVINLSVSMDYEDKIQNLTERYGKKREMVEAAIDLLYEQKNKEEKILNIQNNN